MKIVFAGGGTGGHFYPIIAVAESVNKLAASQGIVGMELYYISDSPYEKETLEKNGLTYIEVRTGKIRTYMSPKNITDKIKTFFAVFKALWKLFVLYPDVVFGKGGYASFPAVCAARILRIPVIIHESDAIPGRVNRWAAPYAQEIGIAFPEAAKHFHKTTRTALVGNPVREALIAPTKEGAHEFFHLDPAIQTILVLGGSQGSEKINEITADVLTKLVEKFQVIHQCGRNNYKWIKTRTDGALANHPLQGRYVLYPFLDQETLRRAAGAADLIIARAGSSLFEFALWGIPSILIPLPIAREDHQRENAYNYARTGAAIVLEEANLKAGLFSEVVESTLSNPQTIAKMKEGTKQYAHSDAAEKIAKLLLSIALSHE